MAGGGLELLLMARRTSPSVHSELPPVMKSWRLDSLIDGQSIACTHLKQSDGLQELSHLLWQDLYSRIDQTRPVASLEDSQFNYGFNSHYLQRVVSYWRNDFDWRRQVDKLNQYPHFKTKIEGEAAQVTFKEKKLYCFLLFLIIKLPYRHWHPLPAREAQEGARGEYRCSSHNGSRLAWLLLWVLWVDPTADRAIRPRRPRVWGGVSLHTRIRLLWGTT